MASSYSRLSTLVENIKNKADRYKPEQVATAQRQVIVKSAACVEELGYDFNKLSDMVFEANEVGEPITYGALHAEAYRGEPLAKGFPQAKISMALGAFGYWCWAQEMPVINDCVVNKSTLEAGEGLRRFRERLEEGGIKGNQGRWTVDWKLDGKVYELPVIHNFRVDWSTGTYRDEFPNLLNMAKYQRFRAAFENQENNGRVAIQYGLQDENGNEGRRRKSIRGIYMVSKFEFVNDSLQLTLGQQVA